MFNVNQDKYVENRFMMTDPIKIYSDEEIAALIDKKCDVVMEKKLSEIAVRVASQHTEEDSTD